MGSGVDTTCIVLEGGRCQCVRGAAIDGELSSISPISSRSENPPERHPSTRHNHPFKASVPPPKVSFTDRNGSDAPSCSTQPQHSSIPPEPEPHCPHRHQPLPLPHFDDAPAVPLPSISGIEQGMKGESAECCLGYRSRRRGICVPSRYE